MIIPKKKQPKGLSLHDKHANKKTILSLGKPKPCHQSAPQAINWFRTPFPHPIRIVRQIVGRPFQIRIPTIELGKIYSQIDILDAKCENLRRMVKQQDQGVDDVMKVKCREIATSTKKIEEDLSTIVQYSRDHDKSGCADNENYGVERVVREMQETYEQIDELQLENEGLMQQLSQIESETLLLEIENKKLRDSQTKSEQEILDQ